MDKLIVTGLGKRLDGEYECDIRDLIIPGTPDYLTYREARGIKQMTGMRGRELAQAFIAQDPEIELALASVILARNGKTLDEETVLDSPPGSKIQFVYGDEEEEGEEDGPPVEPATTPETENEKQQSSSGGKSTTLTLAPSASVPSPTGPLASEMSVTSGQAT